MSKRKKETFKQMSSRTGYPHVVGCSSLDSNFHVIKPLNVDGDDPSIVSKTQSTKIHQIIDFRYQIENLGYPKFSKEIVLLSLSLNNADRTYLYFE